MGYGVTAHHQSNYLLAAMGGYRLTPIELTGNRLSPRAYDRVTVKTASAYSGLQITRSGSSGSGWL